MGTAQKHPRLHTGSRAPDPLPLRQDGSHHQESSQHPREATSMSPTQRPLCRLLAPEGLGPLGRAAAPSLAGALSWSASPHRGPTSLTGEKQLASLRLRTAAQASYGLHPAATNELLAVTRPFLWEP